MFTMMRVALTYAHVALKLCSSEIVAEIGVDVGMRAPVALCAARRVRQAQDPRGNPVEPLDLGCLIAPEFGWGDLLRIYKRPKSGDDDDAY